MTLNVATRPMKPSIYGKIGPSNSLSKRTKHNRLHSCFQAAHGFIINHVSDTTDYFQLKDRTVCALVKVTGKGKFHPTIGHEVA